MARNKATFQSGSLHPKWKGDKTGYTAIHIWLTNHFGNPPKCEKCGELGVKVKGRWNIHWALIHGKKHSHKRENYKTLCVKHHRIYDGTNPLGGWNKGKPFSDKTKEKMRMAKLGIRQTEEHKRKISAALKGRTAWNKGLIKKGQNLWIKAKS